MFVYDPPTPDERLFHPPDRRRSRLVRRNRRPKPEHAPPGDADAQRLTVLMAASEQSVIQIYRPYLAKNGVEIRNARTGLECVSAVRQHPPDVLLLDSDIPWGQGDGVLAVMQELALLPVVPVLVLATRLTRNVHPVLFAVPGYHHRLPNHAALLRSLYALARCRGALPVS